MFNVYISFGRWYFVSPSNKKRKKFSSILALSAIAPSALIGSSNASAVNPDGGQVEVENNNSLVSNNTKSESKTKVSTSSTLKDLLCKNYFGWLWSAVSYVLLKFNYSLDIKLEKVNTKDLSNYGKSTNEDHKKILENSRNVKTSEEDEINAKVKEKSNPKGEKLPNNLENNKLQKTDTNIVPNDKQNKNINEVDNNAISENSDLPYREELGGEHKYREKLSEESIRLSVGRLFGFPYNSKDFADEQNKIDLYSKRISEMSENFENQAIFSEYTGYNTSWPSETKINFLDNLDLIKEICPGAITILRHLKSLCNYVEMGDKLTDEQIQLQSSLMEKEIIGRSWALAKAKFYLRIEACINSIGKKLNDIDGKNEIINKLSNLLPGRVSDKKIDGIYYGNTEYNLLNFIKRVKKHPFFIY